MSETQVVIPTAWGDVTLRAIQCDLVGCDAKLVAHTSASELTDQQCAWVTLASFNSDEKYKHYCCKHHAHDALSEAWVFEWDKEEPSSSPFSNLFQSFRPLDN